MTLPQQQPLHVVYWKTFLRLIRNGFFHLYTFSKKKQNVVPLGLEPRTPWLWVRCSNQLSYGTDSWKRCSKIVSKGKGFNRNPQICFSLSHNNWWQLNRHQAWERMYGYHIASPNCLRRLKSGSKGDHWNLSQTLAHRAALQVDQAELSIEDLLWRGRQCHTDSDLDHTGCQPPFDGYPA